MYPLFSPYRRAYQRRVLAPCVVIKMQQAQSIHPQLDRSCHLSRAGVQHCDSSTACLSQLTTIHFVAPKPHTRPNKPCPPSVPPGSGRPPHRQPFRRRRARAWPRGRASTSGHPPADARRPGHRQPAAHFLGVFDDRIGRGGRRARCRGRGERAGRGGLQRVPRRCGGRSRGR